MPRLKILLTACLVVFGRSLMASPSPISTQTQASSPEVHLVQLLNRERVQRGLRPLVWDASLCEAGRQHSHEMAQLNYFDHDSPTAAFREPSDRWERFTTARPLSYEIGENLCYRPDFDVVRSHLMLMQSPDHRANILNPDFRNVGVGVFVKENGEMWITEMFLAMDGPLVTRERLRPISD